MDITTGQNNEDNIKTFSLRFCRCFFIITGYTNGQSITITKLMPVQKFVPLFLNVIYVNII